MISIHNQIDQNKIKYDPVDLKEDVAILFNGILMIDEKVSEGEKNTVCAILENLMPASIYNVFIKYLDLYLVLYESLEKIEDIVGFLGSFDSD